MERTDKPRLLNRLNRIEGQVRGVARMVEQDRDCLDILTQLHAVRAAARRVETELLKSHLQHCVTEAMTSGDAVERDRRTAELVGLMDRLRG
ncbi:MAG: metal-sensitive transcriptional regulator [Phenylobacterium sp.]|uniref:metal-sensitive transcriptional regulator n=1 Tax=Phenylobacterium sp. TaxID=1871053 RepID=UPI00121468F3|nr:metal-sensitive transcriptional regulator [Phenylobacterium sp.]TAJ71751.1 MAG: metal-sensitive transcriptional regulator [Phenylobacterium sp.]